MKTMATVLYLEESKNIRELFSLQLRKLMNCEVLEPVSISDAISKLETVQIDIIISDQKFKGQSYKELHDFYMNKGLKIPFIIITDDAFDPDSIAPTFFSENEANTHLQKPVNIQRFQNTIKQAINTFSSMDKLSNIESDVDYSRVTGELLLKVSKVPCDVFFKLSVDKYVKVIDANELFSQELIEKHINHGHNFFFVKKSDFPIFADFLAQELINILRYENTSEEESEDEHKDVLKKSHHLIKTKLQELKIDETTMQLIENAVKTTIRIIFDNDSIVSLIKKYFDKHDYSFDHILLTSYISVGILKNTGWKSTTMDYKLTLASFLHDTALDETNLMKVSDIESKAALKLDRKDIKLIKQHPVIAAETARKLTSLPTEVDLIIEQHHERPDGSGFPKSLTAGRITPLAAVFIMAHEISDALLLNKDAVKAVDDKINNLKDNYNTGNFKVPLKGLLKFFSKD